MNIISSHIELNDEVGIYLDYFATEQYISLIVRGLGSNKCTFLCDVLHELAGDYMYGNGYTRLNETDLFIIKTKLVQRYISSRLNSRPFSLAINGNNNEFYIEPNPHLDIELRDELDRICIAQNTLPYYLRSQSNLLMELQTAVHNYETRIRNASMSFQVSLRTRLMTENATSPTQPQETLTAKIRRIQTILPNEARNTLKLFANNTVKDLGLVTKAFKYEFPYWGYADTRASNYRLACLIKRWLKKRIPYLQSPPLTLEFWKMQRNTIVFTLQNTTSTLKYLRKIERKARQVSFPIEFTWNQIDEYFPISATTGENVRVISLTVPLQNSTDTEGYLIFHYIQDIFKVLETLQRKAIYVKPERNRQNAEGNAQGAASAA